MAEKPILFSGEMVRAILDGRKSQTRRVIKPQPDDRGPRWANRWEDWHGKKVNQPPQPNDILWVRETFDTVLGPFGESIQYIYRADEYDESKGNVTKWRPSIFMPKKACRLWLKVKAVWAERLQVITEKCAIAEGCKSTAILNEAKDDYRGLYAAEHFAVLWDSINGKRPGCSWDSNPWCWCIAFEKQ